MTMHPIVKKYLNLPRDEFFDQTSKDELAKNERWFYINCGLIEHHEIRKVKDNLAAELKRQK